MSIRMFLDLELQKSKKRCPYISIIQVVEDCFEICKTSKCLVNKKRIGHLLWPQIK